MIRVERIPMRHMGHDILTEDRIYYRIKWGHIPGVTVGNDSGNLHKENTVTG